MVGRTIGCEALEQLIDDFCRRITPDFEHLRNAIRVARPDISPPTLAQYLMEFGRGQISQIDEATESEKRVVLSTVDSLKFDHEDVALFHAYASGCIMGLVSKKELPGTLIVAAFEIAALFAYQKYAPEALRSGIRPNALLGFSGETSWEALKREHQNMPWDIE
jgi:hypothetical protein